MTYPTEITMPFADGEYRFFLPITMVTASRGKIARAEPVAALYEQGKVSHCGTFLAQHGED